MSKKAVTVGGYVMGVKGVIYFISIFMFFSSAVCAEDGGLPSEYILNARGDLKDYALINCLLSIDPKGALSEDLKLNKNALSFMGKGVYMIVQNEDTLVTEYDPYAAASKFLLDDAAKLVGYMKSGEVSKSYGCFKSYRSDRFNTFIIKQDAFIENYNWAMDD